MTNAERIRNCTDGMLCSVYYNLKNIAIYSEEENRRLLNICDNPIDFFLWLNKESDDLDDYIFKTRFKKVWFAIVSSDGDVIEEATIKIAEYKDDEYIKSLFWHLFNVHYDASYCVFGVIDKE